MLDMQVVGCAAYVGYVGYIEYVRYVEYAGCVGYARCVRYVVDVGMPGTHESVGSTALG